MTKEFSTKPGAYVLYYQKGKYTGTQIENYCKYNAFVEFVPGIYFKITTNKLHGIKKYIINFFDLYKGKLECISLIKERLHNKWTTNHIEVCFKNIRDEYALYTKIKEEEILLYSNKPAKEYYFNDYKKIKTTNIKRIYTTVKPSEIIFPTSSGGDGSRCFLKGVLGVIGIFSPVYHNNEYSFLSEYEMHCVADKSDLLKEFCMKTPGCKKTVQKMKEGTYLGSTSATDLDGLRLSKYGNKYIINNGNHRACCAKLFGIEEVKAIVYCHEEVNDNEELFYPKTHNNYKINYDNEKVLKSFYHIFIKNGLSEEDARIYLEKDGSDLGLIMLFQNKLLDFR